MKQILIKEMSFVNFKGFRDYKITFDPTMTDILGRNGSGKTTIFDGFTWLLFGKNSEDKKAFEIKTLDTDGKVIPNLPHEVSAVLLINGEEVRLTRRFKELWVRKRGTAEATFQGHEEERLYNDVPCSLKEWTEKIGAICNEETFKFITNPFYFTSQKADVQRNILFKIAGGINDNDIIAANSDFSSLSEALESKTIEEYKRELKAKKSRLKSEIDTIPGRIEENQRLISSVTDDFEKCTRLLKQREQELKELDAQLLDSSERTKAQSEAKDKIIKEIYQCKNEAGTIEFRIEQQAKADYYKQANQRDKIKSQLSQSSGNIEVFNKFIQDCDAKLKRNAEKRESLILEWRAIKAQKFSYDPNAMICPICKREFEPEMIENKEQELREHFNEEKAGELAMNEELGRANNEAKRAFEDDRQRWIDMLQEATNAKQEAEVKLQSYSNLVEPTNESITPLIEADEQWQNVTKMAKLLQEQLDNMNNNSDDDNNSTYIISELSAAIELKKAEIKDLQNRLSKRDVVNNASQRIDELQKYQRETANEISELEGIEFTISKFQKARVQSIENRINSLFEIVKFKLFDTQINGAEVEICTATINGVPITDANAASRFNAGIDIINTISDFEEIKAPIFCDNAESVNQILPTQSQLIRMYVTLDNQLVVKHNNQSTLF